MKKISALSISAIIIPLFFSCSVKQVDYSQRTVSVSGQGSVTVEADTATINLAVITRNKSVIEASNENAEKMNSIRSSLLSNGIAKENISTENYTIYQESRYDAKRQDSVPGDYKVSNQIKVTVKDISKTGEVVDLAIKSGANSLTSIVYGVSNPDIAGKQARTLAIQQAQESANLLAGTSGAQLGKVLSIRETSMVLPKSRNMMAKAVNASAELFTQDAATPIDNAKSTVTVSVEAVYQLR